MKRILRLFFIICIVNTATAQLTPPSFWTVSDTLHKPRRNFVAITEASLATATLISLDRIWYADFPRSSFQFINDNNEWLQMDKAGHVFTSYYVGHVGVKVLRWSGVSKRDQLIYGATLGFGFLTAMEVMDGFSAEWGASWGDVLANGLGTGLYVGQELVWNEQRVTLKYSFHQTQFAELRPNKLGDGLLEEVLKDYNGQTYWLSANVHSFFKQQKIPRWFNIAFGYGAEGMVAGTSQKQREILPNQQRYRQFYFSIDVDLTKIQTKSKFLKSVFEVINFIKIPAPTLEINTLGKLRFHPIYF
ncbi:DUF2279 domain-containing protein [Kordia zhangzhouensis]|uniref:DUF2279 domain-containing protein n=1 Tax=Kordia zhangzhouensis TaxID=1620405 RepID=UPI000629C28E|nr:DUF2279 domain-containing protein [Kordia zhangzhouensis]